MSLLLFNLYGYQVLFDCLQSRADHQLKTRLVQQTPEEKDFISFTVAAHLPPYADYSGEYEWVDGEVTIDGVPYTYVKRRIFKDSVEFLCLPHTGKMQVESAREQFFKLCNDLQASAGNQSPASKPVVKYISVEYVAQPLLALAQPVRLFSQERPLYHRSFLSAVFLLVPHQPPDGLPA
jgi:hypothetical protein